MSELTELEQQADREARHGHRELVEKLEEENRELALQVIASQGQADEALGRVAELERQTDDRAYRIETLERERNVIAKALHMVRRERDTAWDDAIRAAAKACSDLQEKADALNEEYGEKRLPAVCLEPDGHDCAEAIRALLRKEGGSDE